MATAGALRPTPDRVRETLFNWLREDLAGARCLDLFAGTGALGFEAASRGAKHVVMVERRRDVAAMLESAARTLGAGNVEVVCADALAWRPPAGRTFDIVFLDPPFAGPAPEAALDRLNRQGALAPRCLVHLETNRDTADIDLPPGWRFLHARRAGQVGYHLVSRNPPAHLAVDGPVPEFLPRLPDEVVDVHRDERGRFEQHVVAQPIEDDES